MRDRTHNRPKRPGGRGPRSDRSGSAGIRLRPSLGCGYSLSSPSRPGSSETRRQSPDQPGNYADRKKFQVREYSDSQYGEELERLHDSFSPLVLRCKELGRSMRIGTNHGSLSDRIMNRFGDTPRGMAESALEFVRIAREHNFHEIVLSMKASNPKVMIEAYRLVVALMNDEDMDYPLHLGVTEAGDGEDARIKSAIGIGSLLLDGLGDTIRVSLTEDPVAEIPVAIDLARRACNWWSAPPAERASPVERINPFDFRRRVAREVKFSQMVRIGEKHPPRFWPVHLIPLKKFKKSFRKSLKYKVLPRMLRWRA